MPPGKKTAVVVEPASNAENEALLASMPPPGGLEPPQPRPPLEEETFPGESLLSEDERSRWLILHFALPRTIITCDGIEERTTSAELNDVLSTMAWGAVDATASEWVLRSEEPSLNPPYPSFISYAQYVHKFFPTDKTMDDAEREKNAKMAAEKRAVFTNAGEPGQGFREHFDEMVRSLSHLKNKQLMKAFEIKEVVLDESKADIDGEKSDQQNMMRFGRHQVLPAFWQLLQELTRRNRRFSIVFRTFDEGNLSMVQQELRYFCAGQHPAYNNQNKTRRPPLMTGDKGSRDMRLAEANIGRLDRFGGRLLFANRPSADEEADTESTEPQPVNPTEYEFPPFHKLYTGLMHQILDSANTAAIIDDYRYWVTNDRQTNSGKLFPVDHDGGFAETNIQHIFFDGHIGALDAGCVDIRDVLHGEPLAFYDAKDIFLHRVNFFQAVTDLEYFVKAVDACEMKMSQAIVEARKVSDADAAKVERRPEDESPKDYLYKMVIPALLPALEACQRDRPADPIEFIAFYMLRHPRGYAKTLKP